MYGSRVSVTSSSPSRLALVVYRMYYSLVTSDVGSPAGVAGYRVACLLVFSSMYILLEVRDEVLLVAGLENCSLLVFKTRSWSPYFYL